MQVAVLHVEKDAIIPICLPIAFDVCFFTTPTDAMHLNLIYDDIVANE